MAQSRKYASLPDVDETEAPEIYETPDLTDDASTAQTATVRSDSPSVSGDEGRQDLDTGLHRQRLDRDSARRRFERSVVDAKDANFSDSLLSGRRSYKTTTRRRRRRNGAEEDGEYSDSEEETLAGKLARLRRETDEVRLELDRRKVEPVEKSEVDDAGVQNGVTKLSEMLVNLQTSQTTREALRPTKATTNVNGSTAVPGDALPSQEEPGDIEPTTMAAIASFSDRLTALETSLGLSTTTPEAEMTTILPKLASLSGQITALSSSLISPPPTEIPSTGSSGRSTLPLLDTLATRIRTLTSESEKLALSRKRALEALQELQDARLRIPPSHYHPTKELSQEISAATSDDSSTKISALYATLPTVQDLQPLLHVVLERLRSLQSLHAGAANAKEDLDEIEARQAEMDKELDRWQKGLERIEKQMEESEMASNENRESMGRMVRDLEQRLEKVRSE